MKKIIALFFQLLFCFPFLLFLSLAGIEYYSDWSKILFISCITILLVLGVGQKKFYQIELETDQLLVIPSVLFGTLTTYSLQYFIGLNPILAAALVGLIVSFTAKKSAFILATPIYCGAFVGMTNPSIQLPFYLVGTIGFIAGCLYYLGKNFYGGIGGKLGTIAFTSVIVSILIIKYVLNDLSI